MVFGWADEGTGAVLKKDEPNKGTWILPTLYSEEDPLGWEAYEKPTGLMGIRATFAGLPVAIECTMAVNCADFGVGCNELLPSPTPASELISFPIETEAP